MNKIWNLSLANIRKGKGQAANLLVFVIIAAMLLNLGLLMTIRFPDTFDRKAEDTHAPHCAFIEGNNAYSEKQIDFLDNYPGVTEVEKTDTFCFMADINYNDGTMPASFFFSNADKSALMSSITLAEGSAPKTSGEICLPLLFKSGGGYQIGDTFKLASGDDKFSWQISGFTTEILFGSINNTIFQIYLSDVGFRKLAERVPETACSILRVRLEDPDDSEKLEQAFSKKFFFSQDFFGTEPLFTLTMSYQDAKEMRTLMSNITSIIMLMVSVIIIFISLIVIRFRIRNHIEESVTNFGALKAMGYTGKQLILSTVFQFSALTALGTLFGICLTYALLPVVSSVLEVQSALPWNQNFDLFCSTITAVSIISAVMVVTFLSSYQIRKLQPLTALRQGLSMRKFNRNHLPLESAKGNMTGLLAAKAALQSKGQMIMIFMIVAAVSMAASVGVSIYDNIARHPDSFVKIVVGEIPDAAFFVKTPEDAVKIRKAVEKDENVRKVYYYQDIDVLCGDTVINSITVEDFSLMEGSLLYEGRYPVHGNEIVLGGRTAELKNKSIGDDIEIQRGAGKAEYRIVGLISSTQYYGLVCGMTNDGMHRIYKEYEPIEVYVYLNDVTRTSDLVTRIEDKYAASIDSAVDMQELTKAQLDTYSTIFQAIAYVIIVVTALVIMLTLYLILKAVIIRRRRELGIQKAVGFTTWQLMKQISMTYIPVVMLGVVSGGVIGALGFNSIFVALVKNVGIMTASMPVPVDLSVVMFAGLVVLAYIFTILILWRIRKISAYALVSE